ncbi:MAG: Si-specific NAD(P)(+) transhydrogenase [Gammaproteobacteria bacterium]|jgi:NAD(P) transhydrogenase|nr:Si-specific NAD(P)(+) transhydrogenase [Gammaproteobacteria bacterium]NBR18243.1 Si-specific NAD(P)(+) transhydrogenase [Gammaproteobacteria bacterium]NDA43721.1 Si-specific NAD(P)(+) transhydrogenase [Gammaproteobacteria bacterium]NDE87772.1 Si-specific NAD(P)(+) transhydrogenase [Gammaproteobacteria bacterium]
MRTPSFDYQLAVIGSGPSGQRAAIQAAKLGKSVAIIERARSVGGICVNFGTIPSKTFREAVMHLSGYRERGIYGSSYRVKQDIVIEDLLFRVDQVVRSEIDVIRNQMARNRVELIEATATFVDPHLLELSTATGHGKRQITAEKIVIACGTEAARDPHIPFDGQRVFTSDDVLGLRRLPRSIIVVGAGVIGVEYASMFAALGVRVTIVDKRPVLLPFLDHEVSAALTYVLQQSNVTMRLGEEVADIHIRDELSKPVEVRLKSGKMLHAEAALYSIGRVGATDRMQLGNAGVKVDDRNRIPVNEHFQSNTEHVYAVGDVIGFPSLASTSYEQGRAASRHAFGLRDDHSGGIGLFPYGIYTVPEISTIGKTEDELTAAGIAYEIGKANYREISRGQIIGDRTGLLKIIFSPDDRKLLGVHIMGEGASELIHIGQVLMGHNGSIDYFADAVFNFPTLAECYKTAALDGINRLTV